MEQRDKEALVGFRHMQYDTMEYISPNPIQAVETFQTEFP